jgi:hypothetical protein
MNLANTLSDTDLWLQDPNGFNQVDLTQHPADQLPDEPEPEQIAPSLEPQLVATPEPQPEPQATPEPTPAPEPDQPWVMQFDGGGSAVIEKSSKGWKGVLDTGSGPTQNFYGKTKDELIENLFKAQFHASKLIKEQKKKLRFEAPAETAPTTIPEAERAIGRTLSAEEKVELKLLFETDPDAAFDTWFQKRTGRTVTEVVQKADRGERAERELYMEGVHKQFLANNPTYYPDAKYENYQMLLGYLAKHKLGRKLTPANQQETLDLLLARGLYTVENLDEAFADLTEDGLLLSAPRPAPTPTPAPQPERIVRTETRPRAGLGIRPTETTPTPVAEPKPPSVEDFEKLSTEEIDKLIATIQQNAIRSRR